MFASPIDSRTPNRRSAPIGRSTSLTRLVDAVPELRDGVRNGRTNGRFALGAGGCRESTESTSWVLSGHLATPMPSGRSSAGTPLLGRTRLRRSAPAWAQSAWCINGEWVARFPITADARATVETELSLLPLLDDALPVPVPRFEHVVRRPGGEAVMTAYRFLDGAPRPPPRSPLCLTAPALSMSFPARSTRCDASP